MATVSSWMTIEEVMYGEDGRPGERAAREDVEIAEQVARVGGVLEHLLENLRVKEGNRDGRAEPEEHQDHQGVEDFFPQVRNVPRVF